MMMCRKTIPVVLVFAVAVCEGLVLPQQQQNQHSSASFVKQKKTIGAASASRSSSSSLLKSTDIDLEEILGGIRTHEYDRDADVYRRRNEEYQIQRIQYEIEHELAATTTTTSAAARRNRYNKQAILEDSINTSLQISHTSFQHVERNMYAVMTEQPLVALGIFVLTGVFVAYLSGFFFLDGYIETINPIDNDMIPYWEDLSSANKHIHDTITSEIYSI